MRRRLIENISLPIKPVEEAKISDICVVDNNTLEKLIVENKNYNLKYFPSEKYTPIGVVFITEPLTIMSLKLMCTEDAENGTIDDFVMYFGGTSIPDGFPSSYDANGKILTDFLIELDNSYSTEWQNTPYSITNTYENEYIHPPIQCSWHYHTIGTNKGDWYIISDGQINNNLMVDAIDNYIPLNESFDIINSTNVFETWKFNENLMLSGILLDDSYNYGIVFNPITNIFSTTFPDSMSSYFACYSI